MAEAGRSSTSDDRELWRELRIAPILTGGTSLAVWIGGVTTELYRLINCHDDVRPADAPYRALLELTQTRALIDVVTGTSAGGLNGVLLSTAWALGAPTSSVLGLRDVWMNLGSIDALLRSPNEKDPPSLLRGDDYFWPQLTSVLDSLAAQAKAHPRTIGGSAIGAGSPPRDVDLALTVTTMSGELTHRTDDIGQVLQETHLDHTLRFRTPDFGRDPDWSKRLGLAARTSASIPGVFEASYLPVDERVRGRPAFGDRASFTVGRWAVDGGVLANKPIGAARQRIIERSVGAELRRVALFVNPTPSEGQALPADDADDAPTLMKVATSALSAPHNIGIRHEIDDLREHNERIRRSVDVGRSLSRVVASQVGAGAPASAVSADPIAAMAATLYPQFRHDRAELSVTSMLDRVGPLLGEPAFPRRQVEDALVEAARSTPDWLPPELGDAPEVGPGWSWGIAPIEYGAGMLLELVRRVYQLPTSLVGIDQRRELGAIRAAIHASLAELARERATDSHFWLTALRRRPRHLAQWAAHCYRVWPEPELVPEPAASVEIGSNGLNPERDAITARLFALAVEVARSARRLSQLVDGVSLPDAGDEVPNEVIEAAMAVADLAALLRLPEGVESAPEPKPEPDESSDLRLMALVRRMVAVHVVAVSLGDTARRHAPIELIEVSWRAANCIDPSRRPEDKLAGIEFGRLGAFVKRSWRANDWMWGRMDGAAQLVRLVLDPRRLRQIGVTPDDVLAVLDQIDPGSVTDAERHAIIGELGYLVPETSHFISAPTALPVTTDAFVARVQRTIAREELPEVYFAVLRSRQEGAGEGDGGDFRRAYESATSTSSLADLPHGTGVSNDQVDDLFRRCRIGTETASGEVGEDLLTRTAGRAALVVSNMVTGERSGLRWPSRVARPFRQIALVGYVLTRAATTTSRTGMAVTATLAALAGAIVAMFLLSGRTGVEINSGLALLAMAILLLGLFLAIVRSGVVAALPALLALLVVALALLGAGIAEVITGTANLDPEAAWRHTLFLGSWPIVTFVLLIAGLGWAVSAVSRLIGARRMHRIDVRQAAARGHQAPPAARGALVEAVVAAVVIPLVLWLHPGWIRAVMVGEDEGWRSAVIDTATWLGDRSVVMVITGVVVFGVFFGLAWDRSFRRILVGLDRRIRR